MSSYKRQLTHLLHALFRHARMSNRAFQQPVELNGVFRLSVNLQNRTQNVNRSVSSVPILSLERR